MLRIIDIAAPIHDRERAARIFDGALLVFRHLPGMQRLRARADQLIREAFGSLTPVTAQHSLAREPFLERAAAAQKAFETDMRCQELFTEALKDTGASLAVSYRDRLRLRALPHGDRHAGGRMSSTGVHRDTWGSNIHAQTNWWSPVYELDEQSTIVFYPRFWSQPVGNTSATWSFEALLASRRDDAVAHYPTAPEACAAIDPCERVSVVVEPGDLLCFSGAQLHGGAANTSAHTRFSIETRTVSLDDIAAGRGAPNIDCGARMVMHRWFRHISSGRPLADALSAP